MIFREARYAADGSSLIVPKTWLFPHYYDALTTLFRMENALRVFVCIVLKNECSGKWSDLSITSDDSQEGTIASIAKRRQAQAGTFGYLCFPISCPIMHLTSGELVRLITSDGQWKFFKPYFPASRETVKIKLDEIGCVRNALAHFRPLKIEDVTLLKQNAQHVLAVVERTVEEVLGCATPVPTNTTEEWYTKLMTVGSDRCKIALTQNGNAKWVGISLDYVVPVLKETDYSGFILYQILNLSAIPALEIAKELREAVTFASESVVCPWPDLNGPLEITKSVKFVISREMLESRINVIKEDLEKLLREIEQETELILQDNLAAGKLVRSFSLYGQKPTAEDKAQLVKVNGAALVAADTGEMPEYWGSLIYSFGNFITAAERFPWMPVTVATFDYAG